MSLEQKVNRGGSPTILNTLLGAGAGYAIGSYALGPLYGALLGAVVMFGGSFGYNLAKK